MANQGFQAMSELYEANIAVIQQRWPELVEVFEQQDTDSLDAMLLTGHDQTISINQVQLTSRHGRKREAMFQASQIPEDSEYAVLYGTGLGDVQEALLSREALKDLQVRIMNEAVFTLVLQFSDQTGWLSDARVDLASAAVFREIEKPYVVLPSELVLASDVNISARNQLQDDISDEFINRPFQGDNPEVVQKIQSNLDFIKEDKDVAVLFNTLPGRHVFVIGAGPSLEDNLSYLRKQTTKEERPFVIAVDTAFTPLVNHGVTVDIVVSIDGNMSIEGAGCEFSDDVSLVYFPMLSKAVIASWKGDRLCGYSPTGTYESVRSEHPRGELFSYGSVIHPAIDLAVKMGASTVTLFGTDFCYPKGKSHTHWEDGELGHSADFAREWVFNSKGEKVATHPSLISYLVGVEKYIQAHPSVIFFNSSLEGARIEGTLQYKTGEHA